MEKTTNKKKPYIEQTPKKSTFAPQPPLAGLTKQPPSTPPRSAGLTKQPPSTPPKSKVLLPQIKLLQGTNRSLNTTSRSSKALTSSILTPSNANNIFPNCTKTTVKHPETQAIRKVNDEEKICNICGKIYSHRSALYKHKRKVHPTERNCKAGNIENKCRYVRRHLELQHGMQMESKKKMFSTAEGN